MTLILTDKPWNAKIKPSFILLTVCKIVFINWSSWKQCSWSSRLSVQWLVLHNGFIYYAHLVLQVLVPWSWTSYGQQYYTPCLVCRVLFGSLAPAACNCSPYTQVHQLPKSFCDIIIYVCRNKRIIAGRNFCGIYLCVVALILKNKFHKKRRKMVNSQKYFIFLNFTGLLSFNCKLSFRKFKVKRRNRKNKLLKQTVFGTFISKSKFRKNFLRQKFLLLKVYILEHKKCNELANHLRAVADAFLPIRAHQYY